MSISRKYLYLIPIGFQWHTNLERSLVIKLVANERHHILMLLVILIILQIVQIFLDNMAVLFRLSIGLIYPLFVAKQ